MSNTLHSRRHALKNSTLNTAQIVHAVIHNYNAKSKKKITSVRKIHMLFRLWTSERRMKANEKLVVHWKRNKQLSISVIFGTFLLQFRSRSVQVHLEHRSHKIHLLQFNTLSSESLSTRLLSHLLWKMCLVCIVRIRIVASSC